MHDYIYDLANIYEETTSFLDVIWYTSPPTDHDLPQYDISYTDGELLLYDLGLWQNGYNSSYDYCWGDLNGYNTGDNMHESSEENKENYYYIEEKLDSYSNYIEDAGYHYNSWSGYGTWFGDDQEEDPYVYSRKEVIFTHGYSPDDLQLCESIFGHWPCMAQSQEEYC